MEVLCLNSLLLGNVDLAVHGISVIGSTLTVTIESATTSACCPGCDERSAVRHGTYLRHPYDLPWADWRVVYRLRCKRFACGNAACPKKTFAERFPTWLSPYARQTKRAKLSQITLSLEMSAKAAERILEKRGLAISDTSVNRYLRNVPTATTQQPTVIGIDDWAMRKGHTYGTIVVNHDSGRVIDLLPDRDATTVQAWLNNHPSVVVVTRDRAANYAVGIEMANPQIVQVADRFHLLQNVTDMLIRLLKRQPRWLSNCVLDEEVVEKSNEKDDSALSKAGDASESNESEANTVHEAAERRFQAVKSAQARGLSCRATARELGIDRRTVAKYFALSSYNQVQRGRRKRRIDSYLGALRRRWLEGVTNRVQLHAELRRQGYQGTLSTVYRETRDWPRPEAADTQRLSRRRLSARDAAWLLLREPQALTATQQEARRQLLGQDEGVCQIQAHAVTFVEAVKHGDVGKLQQWLSTAMQSRFAQIRHFARGIKADFASVTAALEHPYSNGRTEGHVNRLKMLKRIMYGRANFDLLRQRVLLQGGLGFT